MPTRIQVTWKGELVGVIVYETGDLDIATKKFRKVWEYLQKTGVNHFALPPEDSPDPGELAVDYGEQSFALNDLLNEIESRGYVTEERLEINAVELLRELGLAAGKE